MPFKEKVQLTLRGYKLIHKLVPGLILSMCVYELLLAFTPFITIYMSGRIITALTQKESLYNLLWLVGITVAANFLIASINGLVGRANSYCQFQFQQVFEQPINEKVQEMDYRCVEDRKTHLLYQEIDMYAKVNSMGLPRLLYAMQGCFQGFFTVVFAISMSIFAFLAKPVTDTGSFSFLFTPWCSLLVIAFVLGKMFYDICCTVKMTQKNNKAMEQFVSANKILNYYQHNMMVDYKAGKDIKLYNLGQAISAEIKDLSVVMGAWVKKGQQIATFYGILRQIGEFFMNLVIYGFIALKALLGGLETGSIVQYVGSLSKLGGGISQLMNNITMLSANTEILEKLFAFLDMPQMNHPGSLSVEKRGDNKYQIEFHNVSFRYPGMQTDVLKNLSLKFNIGERMAVVGKNGCGKTTMIKLLCRLYDPTEGFITLNGIDIRKYDYEDYLNIFSVVFQDFKLLSFSLGENVATTINYNPERVAECLKSAGFGNRLPSLPLGLETPIYKDFDENGVEVSGGEAQKIAIARALYKKAPFVILDEPTAALDPISEFEIYSRFNEMVGDKTTLYISHRLSSCRFCNDILVLNDGQMVQRGSHETLIKDENSLYFSLWSAQAKYYTE